MSKIFTVWIFGWTAIFGASDSGMKAVRWSKAAITMTMTKTVTYSVTVAIIWAGFTVGHGCSQILHCHTFLVYAHLYINEL